MVVESQPATEAIEVAELSIKNFPEDLLKRLKVAAAQEGITLRELVISRLVSHKPAK
jgi:hypothetical protein